MEYDNNNRGAVFPPRGKQKLIFQGNGEIDNKPVNVAIIQDESRDGKPFMGVYVKAGAVFTNSYKEPNDKKPHFTGKLEMFDKRIACWESMKGDMKYLQFRITGMDEITPVKTNDLDDEVPFGKELDKMASDLKKSEGKDVEYDW